MSQPDRSIDRGIAYPALQETPNSGLLTLAAKITVGIERAQHPLTNRLNWRVDTAEGNTSITGFWRGNEGDLVFRLKAHGRGADGLIDIEYGAHREAVISQAIEWLVIR